MTSAAALLVTGDPLLREDVLRLAAAAGTRLQVVEATTDALRVWSSASVVLLGADLAAPMAAHRPGRRDDVHVVGRAPLPSGVFQDALTVGALDVVELAQGATWLVELLSDASDGADRASGGRMLGVVGGSGGAGATTFACALGLVAARHSRAVLVDLDRLGPGLDRVVGLEGAEGARWDVLMSSRGRLGSRSLRAALPVKDRLAVLTWGPGGGTDLDASSVREVVSAARRGHDVVVLDLPRGPDDVVAEAVTRCDRVLLVVEPSVTGVGSAGKVVEDLEALSASVALVVRGGRGAVAADQVAAALGLPLLAELPHQRRLPEHVDLGLGPVASHRSGLARSAAAVLARCAAPTAA